MTTPATAPLPSAVGTADAPLAAAASAAAIRTLKPVKVAERVTFTRLVLVELRKFVDTRAGQWLIGLSVIGSVLVSVGIALLYRQFSNLFEGTNWLLPATFIGLPINLLVPVVIVLLFSQEWGQRTTLTTFAIEPRRGRVLAAKGLVALAISVIGWALIQGLSALTTVVGSALTSQSVDWHTEPKQLFGQLVGFLLSNAMAAAFALVLMNTAAAIVLVMALPSVVSAVGLLGSTGQKVASWIDLSTASLVLYADPAPENGWWKLAVASVLWIVIPAGVGVWRNLTREAN